MQELHGAIDEVNDFYLEKHGRVAAATVQVAEDRRVRLDKAKQDHQKNLALETILCHLRAEGDTRMRKRFFDLFRRRYLSVKREIEHVRKGKKRTRFSVENYCPDVGKGRAGPSGESSRVSERSGPIYSVLNNLPLGPSAPGPRSDTSMPSTTSPTTLPWTPISTSPDNANPDSAPVRNPATRLNPLANPFPDPFLGIQTQPPKPLHLTQPPAHSLPPHLALPPVPIPVPVPGPSRHGPSDNMAPQLPPAVYRATAQLQERLRGVLLGPVRGVPSQVVYDQQWQTQHQRMREYELQRVKGRI